MKRAENVELADAQIDAAFDRLSDAKGFLDIDVSDAVASLQRANQAVEAAIRHLTIEPEVAKLAELVDNPAITYTQEV